MNQTQKSWYKLFEIRQKSYKIFSWKVGYNVWDYKTLKLKIKKQV